MNKTKLFKRKTSKYYIHKEIEIILTKIIHIKNMFSIYKKIRYTNGYEYIYKSFPKTMNIMLQSLIDRIILELTCLIVDYKDSDLCINGFITKFHQYEKDYKEKKYIYIKDIDSGKKHRIYINTNDIKKDISELENYLDRAEYIKEYLKKYRDKTISHNDKKINFKPKYKYKEMKVLVTNDNLEEYIEKLFSYMNNIYSTLFKTQFIYIEEFDGELEHLNRILEEDYKKRHKIT